LKFSRSFWSTPRLCCPRSASRPTAWSRWLCNLP